MEFTALLHCGAATLAKFKIGYTLYTYMYAYNTFSFQSHARKIAKLLDK